MNEEACKYDLVFHLAAQSADKINQKWFVVFVCGKID